jgi:predicted Rossmann fold nucleotide-binding protein DprA/Smf involved in DNA uptake
MQRNRLIYALADAGLVVNAEFEKGGTWSGAIEQLRKFQFVPIYLRAHGELGKGMTALRERGGLPWPRPESAEDLERALTESPTQVRTQTDLPFVTRSRNDVVKEGPTDTVASPGGEERRALSAADELFGVVRTLVGAITAPKTEAELAAVLGVSKPQAKDWIARLVAEGLLEKTKRPIRYRRVRASKGGA